MEKIKVVIFDLDGTLANTLPLCISAFRKSLEPFIDRNVSDEEIIATFGPSEEGTIMQLIPDHYDQGVSDYLRFYRELHAMCSEPFNGIRELLTDLKRRNIHIAMVTGKGKYSTAISLQKFKLASFFEIIETGISAGPNKPAGIQAVLDFYPAITKEQFIYVGDAPGDISASRKAGVKVMAAAWAKTAEPEKLIPLQPDELFYTVADFQNWLNKRI